MKPDINNYEIRTWYSAKYECFLAQCTELDGVLTDGQSPEEAVNNAREALAGVLADYAEEGRLPPLPQNRHESFVASVMRTISARAAASAFGRLGGAAKSARKAASSRANLAKARAEGKKGGRPRKVKEPTASVAA